MLEALLLHLLMYVSLTTGRLHPIIFSAALTTCCRAFLSETEQFPYHTILGGVGGRTVGGPH